MEDCVSRILIIDDDPVLRKSLADILGNNGYETISAKNGAEGLALLNAHPVDLTLIDLALPDIYGLEVLESIKAERPVVEAIILAGNATLDSAIAATNRGAFSYLVKPYEIDQLLLHIRRAIEKQRAERELEASRAELAANHEKLKALFMQVEAGKREWERTMDSIADMVILADSDGGIRRCNRAVREFTGKTYEGIIGADWRELLGGQGLRIGSAHASGAEIHHEETGRWFIFHSYPFAEDAGRDISGVVITINDTTELKRTAQALDKAYTELKSTQAQMLQREKMASIGQLAAGVAHEINNPLGFILSNLASLGKYAGRIVEFIRAQSEVLESLGTAGNTAFLEEKRKELKLAYIISDMTQLIKETQDGAERVRKIVQDLKTFSRVDEPELKLVDINECLESTLNIVWNELKYKAELKREYGELPPVRCNPGQLNQVFMNLLINAADAIEKDGMITVRSRREEGFVRVDVSDSGCGIPEEIRARIFEPFFTTKKVGTGTGLGLSISYDIVKKHEGEICVESRPGEGTTFSVLLPVERCGG